MTVAGHLVSTTSFLHFILLPVFIFVSTYFIEFLSFIYFYLESLGYERNSFKANKKVYGWPNYEKRVEF